MSSDSAAILNGVTTFVQNHQASFGNALLVTLTLGGEQVFRIAAFNCPCDQPTALAYGCSFLFGPAVVLLALGILVNNMTWRLCQGCVHRLPENSHGAIESFLQCSVIVAKACVAPSAWLFVAMLDGNYYMCLASPAPCERDSEANRFLIAKSQIISWIFLVTVVAFSSAVLMTLRCRDRLTFLHGRFMRVYRDTEHQCLEEVMKQKAQELADYNVKIFFNKTKRNKGDWEAISMAPMEKIAFQKHLRKGEPFYTPLHRWTSKEKEALLKVVET